MNQNQNQNKDYMEMFFNYKRENNLSYFQAAQKLNIDKGFLYKIEKNDRKCPEHVYVKMMNFLETRTR